MSQGVVIALCLPKSAWPPTFVKTSTGFSTRGAAVHDAELMSAATKETPTEVKASGGIHTTEEAEAMINAGATKLGVSHSMQVIGKE